MTSQVVHVCGLLLAVMAGLGVNVFRWNGTLKYQAFNKKSHFFEILTFESSEHLQNIF